LDNLGIRAPAGLVLKLVAIYRGHKPRLTLFTEARWAIERFRGHLKLGLITDGYAETQRNKVAALEIGGLFDCIVYTDDLGRENWKPSPMPFRLMMNRLGVDGHECIYIGDNPVKDFLAPNELGWLTVMISREGGEYRHAGGKICPSLSEAKKVISSLCELSDFVE
jgi:putative hydrolase of the HAD superfamily